MREKDEAENPLPKPAPFKVPQKPNRVFRLPYKISYAELTSFDENTQMLACGMIDGGIVVLDLVLGVERFILDRHPSKVTALAFYEDKILVSGSMDGSVHMYDI